MGLLGFTTLHDSRRYTYLSLVALAEVIAGQRGKFETLGFVARKSQVPETKLLCTMPPKKPPKGTSPNDTAPDASTHKNASDTELKDKELKQLKATGKAQPKAVAEQKAVSNSAAAKKRTKRAGSGSQLAQNLLSALALVAAVGTTYYLTLRPTPSRSLKPPRVDPWSPQAAVRRRRRCRRRAVSRPAVRPRRSGPPSSPRAPWPYAASSRRVRQQRRERRLSGW